MNLLSDLRIQNNSTLTITSEIYIAEGIKIIVEQGSQLIVNGGKLSNMCMGLWQGIEVWGYSDSTQYTVGGHYQQGRLILQNGAVIENANEAICLFNPDDGNNGLYTSGGIVLASNSTIRNVQRGAQFIAYRNYHPSTPTYSRPNASYFSNCTFELTQALPNDVQPGAFVTLWGVDGVRFTGCTFQNTRTDGDSIIPHYGRGIYCIDAGFKVQNTVGDSNVFKNLWVGIWATGGNSNTRTYSVNKSSFKNCQTGIISDGINNMLITENDFVIGGHPGAYGHNNQWGISLMNGIQGFKVEANQLTQNSTLTSDDYTTAGIWTTNTGITDNNVYRNTFTLLYRGLQASGINKYNASLLQTPGMKYECNSFNSIGYDMFVPNPSGIIPYNQQGYFGIKTYQGNTTTPAGNYFSNNSDYREADLYNRVPNLLRYHYYDGDAQQFPDSVSPNVNLVQVPSENTCPSTFEENGDNWGGSEHFSQLQTDFTLYNSDYIDKIAEMEKKLDGGNTQALLDSIINADEKDTLDLYNLLDSFSPFLSEAVLTAVAGRTDILTNERIFQLMLNNPGGLRNDRLLDTLNENAYFAEHQWVDSLYKIRGNITDETLLSEEITYYGELRTRALDGIVGYLLTDTNGLQVDALIPWLKSYGSPQAEYNIVNTYMETGNYTLAQNWLDSIEVRYNLTEAAAEDMDNYRDYIEFMVDIYHDDRTMAQLDSSEVAALDMIAKLSENYTGSRRARNVLNFFYGFNYWDEPAFDTIYDPKSFMFQWPLTQTETNNIIKVYPNPAEEYIMFEYDLDDTNNNLKLTITDLIGQNIYSVILPGNKGIYMLNLSEWTSGVFVYVLSNEDIWLKSGKIIVK